MERFFNAKEFFLVKDFQMHSYPYEKLCYLAQIFKTEVDPPLGFSLMNESSPSMVVLMVLL